MLKLLVAVFAGALIGGAGPEYAMIGGYSLILWGLVAIGLGFWGNRGEALRSGAVYGFVLSFAFMVAGYTGSRSLVSRFPFFAILGLFGAVCGIGLSALGYYLKPRFARRPNAV